MRMRGTKSLLAAFAVLVLTAQAAWADTTLQTSTDLSTDSTVPETVYVGANSFEIKLWGVGGNIPDQKSGQVAVTTSYSMATNGTITPGATTQTLTFPKMNYNTGCPSTGAPLGCPSNPFVVTASLVVAPGTPGGTNGTVTVVATPGTQSGVEPDATPAAGYVRVQVANSAPSVDAGGPYSGSEGTAIALDGTATDPDSDPLTLSWSASPGLDVDAGAGCTFSDASIEDPTISCTDDGTWTLTLTADDGVNAPVSDTAVLTVGNVDPVVGAVSLTRTGSCGVDLSAAFSDAGSNDTHDSSIDWGDSSGTDDTDPDTTPVTGSHTYASAGAHTISVTVNDDDGGTDSNTASFTAYNTPSNILQPINTTGQRSSFKLGSTIPVKITVTGCDGLAVGGLSDIAVRLYRLDSTPDVANNEPTSTASPTSGTTMRWDATGLQYIYNLSTKNSQLNGGAALSQGTYKVELVHSTFASPVSAIFDLRR